MRVRGSSGSSGYDIYYDMEVNEDEGWKRQGN